MEKNIVIGALRAIGVSEAAICCVAGIVAMTTYPYQEGLGITIIVSGVVIGVMLWGFADIIQYLQLNTYYQKEILRTLQESNLNEQPVSVKTNNAPKTDIVEIESALPKL